MAPELSMPGATGPRVSYAELIAVLLTGLAISLAILGITIAGFSIWGYRAIRDESKAIAVRTVRSEAKKQIVRYLSSDEGAQIVENEVARRLEELKEGNALAASQPKGSTMKGGGVSAEPKVGKPYKKGGQNERT